MLKRPVLVIMVIILCTVTIYGARNIDCSIDNCTSMVALYHLDGTSGTIIDSFGTSQDGLNQGATLGASGKIGNAVSFDGSSGYLDMASATAYGINSAANNFSIGMWVKVLDHSTNPFLFDNYNSGGPNIAVRQSGERVQVYVRDSDFDDAFRGSALANMSDGQWHHVVLSWDASIGRIYEWFDGINAGNQLDATVDASLESGADFQVGARPASATVLNGSVDEIFIYNRFVTLSEALRFHNLGIMPVNSTTQFNVSSGSTDFANATNMSGVSVVLVNQYGSLRWNNPVDARNDDYDKNIRIGSGFVSVNTSALNLTLNTSVNVSVQVDGCDTWTIYHSAQPVSSVNQLVSVGSAIGSGSGTSGTCNSLCSNPICIGGVLTFEISHLDGAGGVGANPVPEFSTIALFAILGLVLGGFVVMRRR